LAAVLVAQLELQVIQAVPAAVVVETAAIKVVAEHKVKVMVAALVTTILLGMKEPLVAEVLADAGAVVLTLTFLLAVRQCKKWGEWAVPVLFGITEVFMLVAVVAELSRVQHLVAPLVELVAVVTVIKVVLFQQAAEAQILEAVAVA
jgi:hypothetical protein